MRNTLGAIGKAIIFFLFLMLIHSTTASAQSFMIQDMDRRIRALESVQEVKRLSKLAGVSSEEEKYTDRRIEEVDRKIKDLERRVDLLQNLGPEYAQDARDDEKIKKLEQQIDQLLSRILQLEALENKRKRENP